MTSIGVTLLGSVPGDSFYSYGTAFSINHVELTLWKTHLALFLLTNASVSFWHGAKSCENVLL